jgi:adenylate cyclase class 2
MVSPDGIEREVKLSYATTAEARRAVVDTGATLLRGRRLQDDALLDRDTDSLEADRCALRVRVDGACAVVTFKGPPMPGLVKAREELETTVGDAELAIRLFERLGFHVWFRYQKYREEFRRGNLVIAIDDSPIGVFVELEGSEMDILAMAVVLKRAPSDFVVDSYLTLFRKHQAQCGGSAPHMLFDAS